MVAAALWGMAFLLDGSTAVWVLVVAHVSLSVGLALMFTPLFTTTLGSVRPDLYSHGSATISTLQQLAGAAGTALAITAFTATSTSRAADGASIVQATADGIRSAVMWTAGISLLTVVTAVLVRPIPPPK